MAVSELATMEPRELVDRLAEARKELFNLRFQQATGQLDNSSRVRAVRKEVARILTYLRQHELAEDGGGAHAALRGAAAPSGTGVRDDDEEDA